MSGAAQGQARVDAELLRQLFAVRDAASAYAYGMGQVAAERAVLGPESPDYRRLVRLLHEVNYGRLLKALEAFEEWSDQNPDGGVS